MQVVASAWTNYYVAKYQDRKCVYVRLYDVYMDRVWYTYIDICIQIYLYIYTERERERGRERERERFAQTGQSDKHTPSLKAKKRKEIDSRSRTDDSKQGE